MPPEEVLFLIIHHAAAYRATATDIHQWHLDRGDNWKGFGYGEYIRKNGTVYIGRGDHQGAHTKGYNDQSYSICLEGNFNEEFITKKQAESLIERLKYHKDRFKYLKSIGGHRDFTKTECPGVYFD